MGLCLENRPSKGVIKVEWGHEEIGSHWPSLTGFLFIRGDQDADMDRGMTTQGHWEKMASMCQGGRPQGQPALLVS